MIAIVGGGPSGIALAKALDRIGMSYTLFEARQLGSTWLRVPPELQVLSPWWTNTLDLRGLAEYWPLAKAPAGRYAQHLRRVSSGLRGTLEIGTRVEALRLCEDGGFELRQRNAKLESAECSWHRLVVICTGYFDAPESPRPAFESDDSITVLHAAVINDFSILRSLTRTREPVLLVGKRVTAGQVLLKLIEFGVTVEISSPSPIEFRRHGTLAWLREMAYYPWEALQILLDPALRRNSYPPMEGGRCRKLIDSGKIQVRAGTVAVRNGHVHFADGSSQRYGAVILATGYAPNLAGIDGLPEPKDPLRLPVRNVPGFELADLPGVFLLGFDNLRNHRSRYLRGIRDDARVLASLLSARLESSR